MVDRKGLRPFVIALWTSGAKRVESADVVMAMNAKRVGVLTDVTLFPLKECVNELT